MSAEGWVLVIGAFFLGAAQLAGLYFAYRERLAAADREAARVLREEAAAEKVEEVRVQAIRSAKEQRLSSDRKEAKLDALTGSVEEVRREANGMKAELVKVTGEAAFAQGVKSETDKKGA